MIDTSPVLFASPVIEYHLYCLHAGDIMCDRQSGVHQRHCCVGSDAVPADAATDVTRMLASSLSDIYMLHLLAVFKAVLFLSVSYFNFCHIVHLAKSPLKLCFHCVRFHIKRCTFKKFLASKFHCV